ncbi:hypothetical protein [Rickettsia rhipicephali]|nr:hypothetical protein [Rickettsia rhipicephali]
MFNSKEEKKLVDVLTKFCKMINKQSDITVPCRTRSTEISFTFC